MLLQIVIIGAKSAAGNGGDISIDDTSLTEEKCGTLPAEAVVTPPTPPPVPTTTIAPIGLLLLHLLQLCTIAYIQCK